MNTLDRSNELSAAWLEAVNDKFMMFSVINIMTFCIQHSVVGRIIVNDSPAEICWIVKQWHKPDKNRLKLKKVSRNHQELTRSVRIGKNRQVMARIDKN